MTGFSAGARPQAFRLRAVLATCLALIAAGCGADAPGKAAGAETVPTVEAILVAAGAGAADVRAAGMVAYEREAMLSFRTPGLIRDILVDEGDEVRQGQTIARLDLRDVNAALAAAETSARNAEDQFARNKSLFDRGFIAKAALDSSELSLKSAQATLTAARFSRDQAVITAPRSGVILRRLAEPNQNVASGAPVVLFGSRGDGVIVRAGLAADTVRRIQLGDTARVRLGDGKFRSGRVSRIAAKSDQATSAFDIEISLDDRTDLRSGQVGEVLVRTKAGANPRLQVPVTALLDARADQGFLYVIDAQEIARRRSVRTAGVEGEDVIIAEGLKVGERVIVAGGAFVRDGQTVSAVVRAAGAP